MIIELVFRKLGFIVSDSGILVTSNKFARFIANLAVQNNSLKNLTRDVYSIKLR
jgi:hypothetical protein